MDILITFGSETGTAETIAESLYRECCYHRMMPNIMPMNEVSLNVLQNRKIAVFICSTTGDGEEPRNMKTFWRAMLRKSLPSDLLSDLHFGVLGLGDSSYAKYNYVAKRLYRRILNLGGKSLSELGLGDDQHPQGCEYTSFLWIDNLFINIRKKLLLTLLRDYHLLPPKFSYHFVSRRDAGIERKNGRDPSCNKSCFFDAVVVKNERVTSADHFQDVRLIKLGIKNSQISYKPGDVVWIYPRNSDENVERACRLLSLDADQWIEFGHSPIPEHVPKVLSIRDLLTYYLDIVYLPSRFFFELCSNFITDEMEKEKCEEFATLEGQDELFSYVNRPRRNLLEVLEDFHSLRKTFNLKYLFDTVPFIKPRGFSIASSLKCDLESLEICMAVVRYKTNLKQERVGLCSTWLANCPAGTTVPLYTTCGSFKFPTDRPIVMVGPGTGCAPFRALIQERGDTKGSNKAQELVIFFGCRHEHGDYFFKDEWMQYTNLTVITAFSRDDPDKTVYVQHKLAEHSKFVWNLIDKKDAQFCVAGNSKNMPVQVKEALVSVVETEGDMTLASARQYVENLIKRGRYNTETW